MVCICLYSISLMGATVGEFSITVGTFRPIMYAPPDLHTQTHTRRERHEVLCELWY